MNEVCGMTDHELLIQYALTKKAHSELGAKLRELESEMQRRAENAIDKNRGR